jgi:hypothetical protein
MRLIFALVMLPLATFADPLETDFDKIFADNAAAIVEKNGGQSLELPNKVLLSRNAEGKYLALDGSPHEAVGCVLRITLQSSAVGQLCPESLTAEQLETLNSNIASFASFYAENNVPTRSLVEVQGAFDEAVDALKERLANLECTTAEVDKFKEFIAILTGADTQTRLTDSFAAARLPVTQPCL